MVLKNIFHIIATIVLLLNNSCSKEEYPLDASGLTYKGKFVYMSQFKMNGIYIADIDGNVGVNYYFIDGTYYHVSLETYEQGDECLQIYESNIPYYWGCFIIEGDTLKVQTFDPTSRQRYHEFRVEERWAKIENDSTLRFFKKITPEKKELELNEIFHFKHCENKPDSTNILMKY